MENRKRELIREFPLPYIPAIELAIRTAFPGRNVTVYVEESPFSPGVMAIKAFVDNVGAYTTVAEFWNSEANVSQVLIAKLQEAIDG